MRRENQARVDSIIDNIRATASPALQAKIDQRRTERLRIREINGLSDAAIRAGLDPVEVGDDRSPAVRFLDIIDLPRNTTANILFGEAPGVGEVAGSTALTTGLGAVAGFLVGGPPGAAIGAAIGGGANLGMNVGAAVARPMILSDEERADLAARSRPGALGQPSIYFSDALEKMGVENKIIRGTVGFTGDVLLDPLTYLSGGGNTVKWVGVHGASAIVSKPASKMLDDIAGHVARTGSLPTDPAYQPFLHLYQNTIKVGDQVIDVGGSGANLRDRLLDASQQLAGGVPGDIKGQQRRIANLLREDLIESARLNPLGGDVAERSAMARDFFRRYGAASDFQFTFPFSGWLSNRLRTASGGSSMDVPIGRFGRSGRAQALLGATEAEFRERLSQSLTDDIARLTEQRQALFGDKFLSISERLAPQIPDGVQAIREGGELRVPVANLSAVQRERMMQQGWSLAPGVALDARKLDQINQALARLDFSDRAAQAHQAATDLLMAKAMEAGAGADAIRAEQAVSQSDALAASGLEQAIKAVEDAGRLVQDQTQTLKSLVDPAVLPLFDPLDDIMRSLAAGDAATAIAGPTASLRKVYNWWNDGALQRAEEGLAAAKRESDVVERQLRINQQQAARRLRQIDPDGSGASASNANLEKLSNLDDAHESLLATKAEIVDAYRTESLIDDVDMPIPRATSSVGRIAGSGVEFSYRTGKGTKGLEGAVSAAGTVNKVDVRFEDALDRIVWGATEKVKSKNTVALAQKREALQYAQRVFGVSRGRILAMGRELRRSVKSQIEDGRVHLMRRTDDTEETLSVVLPQSFDAKEVIHHAENPAAFAKISKGHRQLDKRWAELEASGALSSRDRILLRAIFSQFDEKLISKFSVAESTDLVREGIAGRMTLGTSFAANAKPYKVEIAAGLSKSTESAQPVRVFLHETGHVAWYAMLNDAERMLVKNVHEELIKSGQSIERNLHEWFADSFAFWAIAKKSPSSLLTKLYEKVASAISKAIARLTSNETAKSFVPPEIEEIFQTAIGKRGGATDISAATHNQSVGRLTAGASAGADAGGRALTLQQSSASARRRGLSARITKTNRKGETTMRLVNKGLLKDIPRDVQSRLRFIDRSIRMIESQKARAADVASEIDDILHDLTKAEDALDAQKIGIEQAISSKLTEIDAMKEGTFYRSMQRVMKIENVARRMFGIGRKGALPPLDQLRRELEQASPYMREQVYKSYLNDIEGIQRQFPGVDSKQINDVIQIRIADIAQKNSGLQGFHPTDVLVRVKAELEATEAGQKLLSDPMVEQIANKYLLQMSNMLEIEQRLGILPDFDPKMVYFPGTMTEKARDAMFELAERIGQRPPAGAATRLSDALPFTMRKISNRIFYGPPSKQQYIYVGELARIAPGDTGHAFEAWRQSELRRNPSLAQAGDLFDMGRPGGIRNGQRWMPDAYPTSAAQLNASRSEFMRRVGQEISGPIFEEDLLLRIAGRTMQHEHATAFNRFREGVSSLAEPISPDIARTLPRGLGGGVLHNGVEYRPLNAKAIRDSKIRIPIPDEELVNYYPVAFAEAVEDYAKKFSKPGELDKLLKPIDAIQSVWKQITLFHPSWAITNIIGGAFNSFVAAGTRPEKWLTHTKNYAGLVMEIQGLRKATAASDALPIAWGGAEYTRGELKELFVRMGAANAGRTMIEALNATTMGPLHRPKAMESVFKRFRVGKAVGKWFQANAATDDLWRVITLTDMVDQGHSIAEAQRLMIKAHFDYSDITRFEQQVGLRVWPFYRWMRNNVALQFKLFVDKPEIAASFPKLKNAIEEQFDAEQLVPEEMRPRWMKDNIAVQISARPEAKFALLSLFTPVQELIELGQVAAGGGDGFAEGLKYLTSSMNPMLKAPIELSMGQEFFTGREIGDPSLGKLSRMEYLAQQIRPYREYKSTTRMLSDSDKSVDDFIARFLVGGRLQQTSDEKLEKRLVFESGETTRLLRSQIKRSLAEGDTERAQKLSLRVIELYRDLYDMGMYESVPRELRGIFKREAMN